MQDLDQRQFRRCVECLEVKSRHADFYTRHAHCKDHRQPHKYCRSCRASRNSKTRQPRCKDCDRARGRRYRRYKRLLKAAAEVGLPEECVERENASYRVVRLHGIRHAPAPSELLARLRNIAGREITLACDEALRSPDLQRDLPLPIRVLDAPPNGRPRRNFARFYDLSAAAGGFGPPRLSEPGGYVDTGAPAALDEFVIEVTGESMIPTIPNGSHCVFRETGYDEALDGHVVLACGREEFDPEDGGRYTVKRLKVRSRGKELVLLPENRACEPIVVRRADDVQIIGAYRRRLTA